MSWIKNIVSWLRLISTVDEVVHRIGELLKNQEDHLVRLTKLEEQIKSLQNELQHRDRNITLELEMKIKDLFNKLDRRLDNLEKLPPPFPRDR